MRPPTVELVPGAENASARGSTVLGSKPRPDARQREFRDYAVLFIAGVLVAAGVVLVARVPVAYAAGGVAGLAYLILCARRPALGCAVLVGAVPLIQGLGRGTVIPLLRPSEAMMALLIVGALVHELPRRRSRSYSGMDVAVLAFGLGTTLIPLLYLSFNRPAGIDGTTWFGVFAPLQYLATYLLFSRVQTTDRDRRLFLNVAMAASVIVSLLGIAELANLPGVQSFLHTYYPPGTSAGTVNSNVANSLVCGPGGCRPASVMQHYSAFGAYAVLSYTVALALLVGRRIGFDRRWLLAVLILNALGVFVSETIAAVVGLVLATVIVLLHRRTFPRQLVFVVVAVVIGVVAFWGPISTRIQEQTPTGDETVAGISLPENLALREQYWSQLFWPDLREVIWTGTGDVLPGDIPPPLTAFVDNEYLGMGFRAGIGGEVLLLLMLVVIGVTGWRARKSRDPLEVALGGMAVAYVAALAVMGTTAQYLTFAGVNQAFWVVIGMFAGVRAMQLGSSAEPVVQVLHDVGKGTPLPLRLPDRARPTTGPPGNAVPLRPHHTRRRRSARRRRFLGWRFWPGKPR